MLYLLMFPILDMIWPSSLSVWLSNIGLEYQLAVSRSGPDSGCFDLKLAWSCPALEFFLLTLPRFSVLPVSVLGRTLAYPAWIWVLVILTYFNTVFHRLFDNVLYKLFISIRNYEYRNNMIKTLIKWLLFYAPLNE